MLAGDAATCGSNIVSVFGCAKHTCTTVTTIVKLQQKIFLYPKQFRAKYNLAIHGTGKQC
jgi:hypothetical protein